MAAHRSSGTVKTIPEVGTCGTTAWIELSNRLGIFGFVNYIHHNPVHHGYVGKWQDWPWSSAEVFIKRVGRDAATRIWNQYPVLDYGKTWDVDEKPD